MPVTAVDITFFASQTMQDTADGGGPRASTVLQTGVSNTTFPDVSAADRLTGRVRLRKVYVGPTNADNAALLGASLAVNEVPTDPATSVAMFAFGDATTRRSSAVDALEHLGTFAAEESDASSFAITFSSGGTVLGISATYASGIPPIGAEVFLIPNSGVGSQPIYSRIVVARNVATSPFSVTVDRAMPAFAGVTWLMKSMRDDSPERLPRLYGSLFSSASVSSGATSLSLTSRYVLLAPYVDETVYPASSNNGIAAGQFRLTAGRVRAIFPGDTVTLWHEAATTAATAIAGGTVTVGRTSLDQLAVVGSDGVEIARFLRGGPTPAGGTCTADLDAGTVTFSAVTGYAQPVTVRHRIAHRSLVSDAAGVVLTLGTPVTRDFPAVSVVSSHLPLGDLQARAFGAFGQQAWTRVFSDALIGNPASLQYTGAITCTNQGAETDRWAIVFGSATDFACYSERLGLAGAGTTTAAFAPVNPATGAPFFSLPSSGWASGILVGSVLRFNSTGAAAAVWLVQTIKPSTSTGTTRAALRLFGSV